MEPGITFIVTYSCPHCLAALEARTGATHGWLRCPKCGRASLPPEHMRTAPRPPPLAPDEDVLVIGPSPDDARTAHRVLSTLAAQPGSPRRIVLGVGFFVSIIMLLFSFLDRDSTNTVIFGAATVVLLGLLLVPPRRR